MPTEKIPLVSVIIPMYNAAKFITQTLESLCYQTMRDFEVVVVDDCSTDNSVEVVEGFAERFDGRLHVVKLPKNTGAPYLPRNVGINFACGKYIAFLDNDDLFTKTALEELTTLAEKYQADVINMPTHFYVKDNNLNMEELFNRANYTVYYHPQSVRGHNTPILREVKVISQDIAERIKLWFNWEFQWATWATFCLRDFWVSNQITFPHMPVSDDMLANFACLCFAKKFLSVPNIVYIQRNRANSISREKDDLGKFIHKWVSNIVLGFKALDEIINRVPLFSQHPEYRYVTLNWFFYRLLGDAKRFPTAYSQIHPNILHLLVEKEFSSNDAALSAYLFNTVNIQQLQIMRLQQELAKFHQQ